LPRGRSKPRIAAALSSGDETSLRNIEADFTTISMGERPETDHVPSSVLFKSKDASVWLLDLPRSLEESQVPTTFRGSLPRRLYSSSPPSSPYVLPEPADESSMPAKSPAAQVRDLMTTAAVQSALEELRSRHTGRWCLPRLVRQEDAEPRERAPQDEGNDTTYVPPGAEYLLGTIQDLRSRFLSTAPKFDLIILDPPWPNRSARRKADYGTLRDADSVCSLLSLIPVASRLEADGLVAVWVTNRAALHDLLAGPGGIFAQWGVELIGEWTWLKITNGGEPIFDLPSSWRKPWEQLLIARRTGSGTAMPRSRVVAAVPDAHSRKPHLRPLFDDVLRPGYVALEIFARSLTAGWWSWGDEVLKFQDASHWHHMIISSSPPS
jgi:N6-adenosine-specific RNA methylase IME4